MDRARSGPATPPTPTHSTHSTQPICVVYVLCGCVLTPRLISIGVQRVRGQEAGGGAEHTQRRPTARTSISTGSFARSQRTESSTMDERRLAKAHELASGHGGDTAASHAARGAGAAGGGECGVPPDNTEARRAPGAQPSRAGHSHCWFSSPCCSGLTLREYGAGGAVAGALLAPGRRPLHPAGQAAGMLRCCGQTAPLRWRVARRGSWGDSSSDTQPCCTPALPAPDCARVRTGHGDGGRV